MNRSSWASGSGYVPSCSTGFCVAITMNGVPRRVRLRVDRDLPLLHALQQGRLRLRRCAVDLVAEHDVGEHRAGAELEVAALLVEHVHAGDVGGQHVGRELDAPERAVDRPSHRLGEHRLADAGHVLDQQVSFGDQRNQRQADLGVLAADDPLDVVLERVELLGEGLPVARLFAKLHHDNLRPFGRRSAVPWVGCVTSYPCCTLRLSVHGRAQPSDADAGVRVPVRGDRWDGSGDGRVGPAVRTPRAAPVRNSRHPVRTDPTQGYTLVIPAASRRLPSWVGRSC